jgi:hydrogenase maturation protein HypF
MKNAFCIVRNREAYLSQHIGELVNTQTFDFFTESVDHLQDVLELEPNNVAVDLHPDYLSSRYGRDRSEEWVNVQHHHAHLAAVLAEQQLSGPVLGLVLDGTGYGPDGTIFGGEIYQADRESFTRLGHLATIPLPGGDRAALEPWRMAMSLLYTCLGEEGLWETQQPPALAAIDSGKKNLLAQMLVKQFNCPATSSCGRLFDGVSALLGLCLESQYEGQAAMLLEQQAFGADTNENVDRYPQQIERGDGQLVLAPDGLVAGVLADIRENVPLAVMARAFHYWLAAGLIQALEQLRQTTGLNQVVLAGGCMQNMMLFERLSRGLRDQEFMVYAGELVPMNDGGLALGQAYIGGVSCV